MGTPVIGQIRSFQDVQRALEGLRSWFAAQQMPTEQSITTIIQKTASQGNNSGLSKNANLSDVQKPLAAFNNIKQIASADFAGVVRLSTMAEAISGIDGNSAMTPATFTRALASKFPPVNLYMMCRLADRAIKYIPLTADRFIPVHLSDGTAATIPLFTGA